MAGGKWRATGGDRVWLGSVLQSEEAEMLMLDSFVLLYYSQKGKISCDFHACLATSWLFVGALVFFLGGALGLLVQGEIYWLDPRARPWNCQ